MLVRILLHSTLKELVGNSSGKVAIDCPEETTAVDLLKILGISYRGVGFLVAENKLLNPYDRLPVNKEISIYPIIGGG